MDPRILPLLLLLLMLVGFVWNKFRYDYVALSGLIIAVLMGIVPADEAFKGFGHPAVILVAAALVISVALNSSGALNGILGSLPLQGKPLPIQLLGICTLTALMSGFINNVGAVALMLPYTISLAYKSKRNIKLYLMPLAFSSLLGGLTTLIGTPPNIIISTYRSTLENKSVFKMFDYFPVGAIFMVVGLIFISLTARFFIKHDKNETVLDNTENLDYLTELEVTVESKLNNQTLQELSERYPEIEFLGVARDGFPMHLVKLSYRFRTGDIIVLETTKEELENIMKGEKLSILKGRTHLTGELSELDIIEVIVPMQSKALGKTPKNLDMRWVYNVNLIGVARSGMRMSRRLSNLQFHVGDILVLQGKKDDLSRLVSEMHWVKMNENEFDLFSKKAVLIPLLLFASAITLSFLNFIPITIALVGCALVYALIGYIKKDEIYHAIEWPVILLLACLIPIGEGLEKSGSLDLITIAITQMTHGFSAEITLLVLMFVTMILTNVINNAAAALVMAPVAVSLAAKLGVSTDTFLMACGTAASCAFVTPIGHQSNALVMEPGGYAFKDFSYFGIPISFLLLLISLPVLTYVWPLR